MRVDLRLGDLRSRGRVASKLMNVKIPTEVNQKIQKVAEALKASKTEVVIALLNEGLDVSQALLSESRGAAPKRAGRIGKAGKRGGGKKCANATCQRPAVAKGLCGRHYQAARRKKLGK